MHRFHQSFNDIINNERLLGNVRLINTLPSASMWYPQIYYSRTVIARPVVRSSTIAWGFDVYQYSQAPTLIRSYSLHENSSDFKPPRLCSLYCRTDQAAFIFVSTVGNVFIVLEEQTRPPCWGRRRCLWLVTRVDAFLRKLLQPVALIAPPWANFQQPVEKKGQRLDNIVEKTPT